MTLHVYANIVTKHGTYSNNHSDVEGGNTATLHKLIWFGAAHTSVSAEALRFALRRRLFEQYPNAMNRYWNDDEAKNEWRDAEFKDWKDGAEDGSSKYIDDDLLGFMSARAAQADQTKGSTDVHRSVLEVTRAISLTPWDGDVHSGYASPNATPSAQKKGEYSAPYAVELHATRYQYGIAMTPGSLRVPSRAALALQCFSRLGQVAGKQGEFLSDYSPDSIILRITDDPAPRLLYCFDTKDNAKNVTVTDNFMQRVGDDKADINREELIIGGIFAATDAAQKLKANENNLFPHVKAAVEEACRRIQAHPDAKGA